MESKGITLDSYNPKGVQKAVFSCDALSNGICQYPIARSKVDITLVGPIFSNSSSMPWHWINIKGGLSV